MGKSLSLYLWLSDWEIVIPKRKVYAKYRLRVVDHFGSKKVEKQGESLMKLFPVTNVLILIFNLLEQLCVTLICFSVVSHWFDSNQDHGFSNLISIEELHELDNGYLNNDTLIVEVEFDVISVTKVEN